MHQALARETLRGCGLIPTFYVEAIVWSPREPAAVSPFHRPRVLLGTPCRRRPGHGFEIRCVVEAVQQSRR